MRKKRTPEQKERESLRYHERMANDPEFRRKKREWFRPEPELMEYLKSSIII